MRSDWRRPSSWDGPADGERRIMMLVSYDGSCFHGWQSQGDGFAVQDELSRVLSELAGDGRMVYGSGRTDAGVHALRQGCHFDTPLDIDPHKYAVIFNTKLPRSIRVLSAEEAPAGFHARFSTQSREYWYLAKRGCDMLPFDARHITQMKRMPDISVLNGYAELLAGTHDFTTFASAKDVSLSRFRDIYVSRWDTIRDAYGYEVLRYRIAGNAFLYHQVRSMAGTMLEAEAKGEAPDAFRARLEARDRSMALKTAPSDGLYLADVSYDSGKYGWFEEEYAGKSRTQLPDAAGR